MKFSRPLNVTADPEKSKCYQKVTIVVLIVSDFYSANVKKIQTVVQNLVWPTGNDSLIVNRSHTWISYLHPEFVQRVFKEGLQLTGFDVAVV